MIDIVSKELFFTGGVRLSNPYGVSIPQGLTVVIGSNGSGKSTFGNIVERGWNFRTNQLSCAGSKPRIKKIEFNDIHSLASDSVGYYQQRYESTMNDSVPAIGEIIGEKITSPQWKSYSQLLGISGLENRKINYLSSGQLRKFLIANALMEDLDLLILDNPYIGLDAPSRNVLNEAMDALVASGMNVMLLISNERDLPSSAATIIPMENMIIGRPVQGKGGDKKNVEKDDHKVVLEKGDQNQHLPSVIKMRGCNVAFGNIKILEGIDWDIRQGEKWWLSGPNGSGKSTLLSLINADNPQAYCNDITLFERKRGTGESIWDIKRRISYISPESTLHLRWNGNVLKIVAQGLTSTTFEPISDDQYATARLWLRKIGLEHLADRNFANLSAGERQMTLLARALVKQPDLMILDEPFHGLDPENTSKARKLIADYASDDSHTLIIVSHYDEELPPLTYHHKNLLPR